MKPKKIILIHKSASAQRIARMFPDTIWIFFGREYLDRMKWESALGSDLKVNYKKKLKTISYLIRDEYVEWLIKLGRWHWNNWEWWITNFATRNNLISPFFLYICYLEVLKDALKEYSRELIIISEDWGLLDAIQINFKENFEIVRPFPIEQKLKLVADGLNSKLYFILVWGKFFLKSLYEWIISKITFCYARPKPDHLFNQRHIVIHTCIDDACFGSDGNFNDRFYPGLAGYLREKGFKVSILTWLFNVRKKNLFSVFKWLRANKESFLIPQDYYNLFDCFRSFCSVMKSAGFKFNKEDSVFRGFDIGILLRQEGRRQYYSPACAYFVNQVSMFARWKKLNFSLFSYVDTWELKNCEVPAIIGIKKYFPSCKIVAYQHNALVAQLWLANYKTTLDEFNASPHADIGIVNGKINKDFLLTQGFPETFIKLGPALRFNYLSKYSNSIVEPIRGDGSILVCLPMKISSACEMLEICYQAFCKHNSNFMILVKFHPMDDLRRIKNNLSFVWPENFKIAQASMEESLKQVKVVIVNGSSTMVESIYRGIGTIILGNETDIDIIHLDVILKDIPCRIVSGADDLREAVKELCSLKIKIAQELKERIFEFKMDLLDDIFV